jgi:hypothetical protein
MVEGALAHVWKTHFDPCILGSIVIAQLAKVSDDGNTSEG